MFILNMLHLKNIIRNVWNKVSFPWKDKYKSTGSCESHYVSLTPEDNLDYEHNEYCKALNWALNQSDVRNKILRWQGLMVQGKAVLSILLSPII